MEGMLSTVEAYYAGIVEHLNASGVSLLRYEALMADPVRTIKELAEVLGVECSETEAQRNWSKFGNKRLAGAGHLWAPGAGKWRQFIPRRFAERICASPLREYAEALGYPWDAEDFVGSRAEVRQNACNPMYVAWEDARWEVLTGKPPAFVHPDVYRVRDEDTGLLMICARQYEGEMERLRQSNRLRHLVGAGAGVGTMEPPLVSDLLGLARP
jgi:hypothetical protein